jgi:hypothetical protein
MYKKTYVIDMYFCRSTIRGLGEDFLMMSIYISILVSNYEASSEEKIQEKVRMHLPR